MSKPHRTTQLSSAELARQLLGVGIIGLLDGDFPPDEILELGDALLASPVLAVAITYSNPRSLQAISILRERGGEHMLVGATNICTAMDASVAVNAGAQFLDITVFRSRHICMRPMRLRPCTYQASSSTAKLRKRSKLVTTYSTYSPPISWGPPTFSICGLLSQTAILSPAAAFIYTISLPMPKLALVHLLSIAARSKVKSGHRHRLSLTHVLCGGFGNKLGWRRLSPGKVTSNFSPLSPHLAS